MMEAEERKVSETAKLPTDLTPLVLHGHVIDVLRSLPENSVQCVVTSPPYWGLRAYGTEGQVWGGEQDHAHEWVETKPRREREPDDAGGELQKAHIGASYKAQGGRSCSCGAWNGELGLEPTPDLYISHLADVFDEVRRVLREDGTLWLNLGDTYTTHPAGLLGEKRWKASGLTNGNHVGAEQAGIVDKRTGILPEKNLVGIPWRAAFELQRRGWFLRSDVIWSKPNPMPESVTDRPTRSHEYIFLLTKNARYYYDADAVRNGFAESTLDRARNHYANPTDNPETDSKHGSGNPKSYPIQGKKQDQGGRRYAGFNARWDAKERASGYATSTLKEITEGYDGNATKEYSGTGAQDPSATKARIIEGMRKRAASGFTNGVCDGCGRPEAQHVVSAKSSMTKFGEDDDRVGTAVPCNVNGANLKSVWQIATQPYPGAHFATFPEAIPERCIRLGTSEKGACAKCGSPWERQTYHEGAVPDRRVKPGAVESTGRMDFSQGRGGGFRGATSETTGWSPTSSCPPSDPVPCLAMDVFGGSGTTGQVARRLGRRSILIELNPEYVALARERSGANVPSLEAFADLE